MLDRATDTRVGRFCAVLTFSLGQRRFLKTKALAVEVGQMVDDEVKVGWIMKGMRNQDIT